VTIKVYSKDLSKLQEVSLLIDTGSMYTWINRSTLKNLQIPPIGSRKFKTVEGKLIEREIGGTMIEYDGERVTTIVVFALEKDAEILGVHALEGLGLEVDPITKKLKKVEAISAV
jgi:predicted aspartyl protease